MKYPLLLIVSASLAGCATSENYESTATETIRYEARPCLGQCPVYAVTVNSDGKGLFESGRFTALAEGESYYFTVTPQQFAEFKRRLAPIRPAGDRRIDAEHCEGPIASDFPAVNVEWEGRGPPSHLYAYLGCDMEKNASLFRVLQGAPYALPMGHLVSVLQD